MMGTSIAMPFSDVPLEIARILGYFEIGGCFCSRPGHLAMRCLRGEKERSCFSLEIASR
jgi:hypothetical protein